MTMMQTRIGVSDADMTFGEIHQRVMNAWQRMGCVGRFSLTDCIGSKADGIDGAVYVTHWFRPDAHAFEDCRDVGSGTLRECLDAVDAYASRWVAAHAPVPAVAAE